jgi:hypothetical protein
VLGCEFDAVFAGDAVAIKQVMHDTFFVYRDGVLIDVSATDPEAAFKFPVALTAAAGAKCVAVPPGMPYQDDAGRPGDVLSRLRSAGRQQDGCAREAGRAVHVRNDNRAGTPPLVYFKAVRGPGDQGEPVITAILGDDS